MSAQSSLDRGIDLVERAIEEDQKQNYDEAYKLYKDSLGYLMLALKYEENHDSRAEIQRKIDEYLTRTETMKNVLDELFKPQQPMAVSATPAKFLNCGLELAEKATDEDQKHNYTDAFRFYQQSLDNLMLAFKYETDAQVKIIIQGKISEYLMRAEVVKTHLKETSMGNIATPDHLTCAIENAREGIEEDEKHNYLKAYKLYQSSLDYFMLALKYETNEKCKTLIRTKISEYLSRAEKLKAYLNGPTK